MLQNITTVSTTDTPEEVAAGEARLQQSAAEEPTPVEPVQEGSTEADEEPVEATTESLEGDEATETVETPVAAAETLTEGVPAEPVAAVPTKPLSRSQQRKNKIQFDIDGLLERQRLVRTELAKEEGRLEERQARTAPPATTTDPATTTAPVETPRTAVEPKQDDKDASGNPKYETYEAWDTAWRTWSVAGRDDEITSKVTEKVEQQLAEERATKAYAERVGAFKTHMQAAMVRHADFEEVTTAAQSLPINPDMHERLVHRELGPEVLYYLCQPEHHDECRRIAALPARDSVTELAFIEAALAPQIGTAIPTPSPASETLARGSVPVPPVTRASPPITPLGAGSAGSTKTIAELAEPGHYRAYKRRRFADARR